MRLLVRASHAVEDRWEDALAQAELSGPKFVALTVLVEAGEPLSLSELASKLTCVRSNITQLIDRLEADLVDPYGPEWMEACDRPSGGDTGVTREEPLSRQWLADRGACCGCGCTHCPYIPRHSRDETNTGGEDDI